MRIGLGSRRARRQDLAVEFLGRAEIVAEGLFEDHPPPSSVRVSRARPAWSSWRTTVEQCRCRGRQIEQAIAAGCRASCRFPPESSVQASYRRLDRRDRRGGSRCVRQAVRQSSFSAPPGTNLRSASPRFCRKVSSFSSCRNADQRKLLRQQPGTPEVGHSAGRSRRLVRSSAAPKMTRMHGGGFGCAVISFAPIELDIWSVPLAGGSNLEQKNLAEPRRRAVEA